MRSSSAAQAEWQKCLEAEKRLKVALRKQSFYDAEPRALRAQLRAGYEALLFLDPSFASANDVEQALWKGVYYRPIEEFRTRMRKAEQAGEPAREQLARTVAAFLKFLDDAAAFYRRLVTQLQTVYGDVGARLSELAAPSAAAGAPAGGGAAAAAATLCAAAAAALAARQQPGGAAAAAGLGAAAGDGAGGSAPRDPRSSVHRSLIYLGDLHRYAAQAAPKAIALGVLPPPPAPSPGGGPAPMPGRADFHRAAACYKMAARVLPRSGNPFNQLAVMAYYANDELRAVYYYFRSLSVSSPFLAARENLLLLLEHNRTKVADLPPPPPDGPSRSANQLASESAFRFIRIAGILFDKINAEDWPRATAAAFATLRGFLAHPGARDQMQRQPRADAIPIHLVVISIFGVHNSAESHPRGGSGAPAPAAAAVAERAGGSRAEAGQKMLSRSRALAAAFRVGATLCHGAAEWCSQAGPTSPGTPHLLIACHVLLQWLTAHPNYAVAGPALAALGAGGGVAAAAAAGGLEPAAAAAVAAAAADEALSRAELWESMARLVPALAAAAPEAAAAWRAKRGAAAALPRVGSGPLEDASMEGGPLPEELELLGFQPLRSKHRGQSVGHTVGDSARGVEEESTQRAARILHESRAIAAALEEEASQLPPGVAADAAAARLLAASRAFVAVAGGGGAGPAPCSDAMEVDAPAPARQPAGAGFAPMAQQFHQPQQQQQWQQQAPQQQQQQQEEEEEEGIDVTPEEEEEGIDNTPDGEEEVIVFKPRRAGAIAATATATTAAAAAPPAPPLPQQLLLPRQQGGGGSSGLSSPMAGAAAAAVGPAAGGAVQPVTLPSKRALGPIPLSVMMAGSGTGSAAAGAGGGGGVQLPQRRPAPAAAATGAASAAGASTEQELQQTHAASAALLARLAARGSAGSSGVTTPPLPGDMQQQAPAYGYSGGYQQPQPQHPYLQQQQYYAQQQTPQQSPYVGGSTGDWPLDTLTQPRTQLPAVPATSGAPAADAADDDGALDEIERLIAGNRASLELEQTARAAALHILSPGGVGDLAAAAAAGAARPGAGSSGGGSGLGALLGEAAAVVHEVGGPWLQQSNHQQQQRLPQQQHLPPPPFPGGAQQQQPASVLAQLQQQTGRAGSGTGRPLLAASGASSLAGTPRSNASAPAMLAFGAAGPAAAPLPAGALSAGASGGGAGPHPFEGGGVAPRLAAAGLVHIGPSAAGGDLGGLFSAHVGGDIGDGGTLGFASGGILGGGGGTGPASGSGYAMFSGPDLFSSAVPRHRRVSSGFGSGRSSAADSAGAPARVSSPGLSLLEHLAAEQAAAAAAAAGGGGTHQQQQQQAGPGLPAAPVLQATGSGGLGAGAFGFGEALFPASRGPGTSVLPPRDAGGAHNPFA